MSADDGTGVKEADSQAAVVDTGENTAVDSVKTVDAGVQDDPNKQTQEGTGQQGQQDMLEIPAETLKQYRASYAALKEEKDALAAQSKLYEAQLEAQLAGVKQNAAVPVKNEEKKADLDDIGDEELLTVGDFRKLMKSHGSQEHLRRVESQLNMLAQRISHPDKLEAIEAHLPRILKKSPIMTQAIQAAPDPLRAAWELVQMDKSYQDSIKKDAGSQVDGSDPLAMVDTLIKNANKGKSVSSVATAGTTDLSNKYKQMSDPEFKAFTRQVMAGQI